MEELSMRMIFRATLLAATLLALTGCAVTGAGQTQPLQAQQLPSTDLEALQRQQQGLGLQVEQLRNNLLLLEARMQDQQQHIEQLRATLQTQKGTTAGEKAAILPPSVAALAPETASHPPSSPTETYLQAFSDYASGRYAQAVLGFESFLRHFPDNDYAANAQYWLGECFLAQQLHPRAAEAFQKTFSRYPQGAKTPDALLKLANTYQQMNQPDQATAALRTLRQHYPDSTAARQSEQER
jgi:tol-pal system protein YbgF